MYAKCIPITAVEPFVVFPFTKGYLNPEMFKIFYVLGVYVKNVYVLHIYFCFLFSEINADSHKIPTGSMEDKEIEYFTLSYLHGS